MVLELVGPRRHDGRLAKDRRWRFRLTAAVVDDLEMHRMQRPEYQPPHIHLAGRMHQ
ncbi:hypothetical protein IVB02_22210 [Bradyrhizobium sp. 166]|uniref:hypothetical protein n=1 Tax=unclassified Bradyrhizobium TaxID=2631580 RepID=UPI001FF9903B|nr:MULTISPECIES: hypothetical protein [unclassified Bradyrhizobium]MCK1519553.1 hypothetical protein [Bradyrhizobium sp. 17]MCK1604067.1 hypothetical protein [Bradyrhizobium sp. 166]